MGCTSRALVLVYVCTLITRSRSNNKYLAPPRPWPPQITASCSKQEITSSLGSDQNIRWSSPQYYLLGTKTFPRTCVVARREPNQTSPLPKYGVKSGGFSWKGKLKRHSSRIICQLFSQWLFFIFYFKPAKNTSVTKQWGRRAAAVVWQLRRMGWKAMYKASQVSSRQ